MQPIGGESADATGSARTTVTGVDAIHGHAGSGADGFAQLRGLVKDAGLLEPQPWYYTVKFGVTTGLLICSVAILFATPASWLRLLDAVFLAFVFTQIAFLGHDVAHHAVFRNRWIEGVMGLILGNLLLGVSRAWWLRNHNAHHSQPNVIDHDPDIDIPILAFTQDQARRTRGIARFIVKHQATLLFPMFCLESLSQHRQSVQILVQGKVQHRRTEAVLLVLHTGLYCGLIFSTLGLLTGALFIIVHKALTGLYMASVFAPNHKGMPVLASGQRVDFLHRQVLTSRNVRPNRFIDAWYGGLNYQIEHHLFPMMPRNRLSEAQPVVRSFCAQRGIDYYETGMVQSYREMVQSFREISMVLREPLRPLAVSNSDDS